MKIIKEGKLPDTEITTTCMYCKTKFSYTKEDVKPDFRDGAYVLCPVCNKSIASRL